MEGLSRGCGELGGRIPYHGAMKCPHCGDGVHEDWEGEVLSGMADSDNQLAYAIEQMHCPACGNAIVRMSLGAPKWAGVQGEEFLVGIEGEPEEQYTLFPRTSFVKPAISGVPASIHQDYEEAVTVLPFSAKASAALSRRCLQNILVEQGATKRDLFEQIEEAVSKHGFNVSLRKLMNAVRMVGNYAAHPLKDKPTGTIIDVEPGEAELNISTIEALVDFFYIRPAEEQAKIDEINKKLIAAGKPPIT